MAEQPTLEETPAQGSITEATLLEGAPNVKHTPSPTADLADLGALGSSMLVADGGGEIEPLLYPLDPVIGDALPGYGPLPLGRHYAHAFSPDDRTLALVTFLSSGFSRPHALVLLDLKTWQTEDFDLNIDSYVRDMNFSPDGRKLAIHFGEVKSIVMIFDRQRGEVTDEVALEFLASRLRFTGDGSGLMLYGTTQVNRSTAGEKTVGPPTAVLLDAGDLSQRWVARLDGVLDGIYPNDETAQEAVDLHQPGAAIYYFPGLAFAAGGDVLYVIHPDQERFTRVDFSAQQVETVDIRTRLSWLEKLLALGGGVAQAKVAEGASRQAVISPDGQFLYVVGEESELYQDKSGNWQVRSTPSGLQAIRLTDGARLARVETGASQLSISPDGLTLYLHGWDEQVPWTEVVDSEAMEITARLDGRRLIPGSRMNGEPLLLSSEWIDGWGRYHIAVVDPGTLEVLNEWTSSRYLAWLGAQ